MDIRISVSLICILTPLFVFVFLRKYLDKNNLWFIIGGVVIALIGCICTYISDVDHKKILYVNMLTPLYAMSLYKGLTYLFIKQFGRMPIDTFFEYEGSIWDRLFNIIFFILMILVPMFTIIYFIELANAALYGHLGIGVQFLNLMMYLY